MQKKKTKFKLCLFGDGGVGKTSLTQRFLTNVFEEDTKMTIGADLHVKYMEIKGIDIGLRIWDFAGEEKFRVLLPSFAKGADGGIFVFDLTRYSSLKRIDEWLSFFWKGMEQSAESIPILMVGSKLDLEDKRSVDQEEATKIARSKGFIGYFECSSKTGENVENIFRTISQLLMKRAKLLK